VAVPLALAAVRLLVRFGPQELPRLNEVAVDGTVLAFGLAVSLVAGLLFGVLPALRAGSIQASASLGGGAAPAPRGSGIWSVGCWWWHRLRSP